MNSSRCTNTATFGALSGEVAAQQWYQIAGRTLTLCDVLRDLSHHIDRVVALDVARGRGLIGMGDEDISWCPRYLLKRRRRILVRYLAIACAADDRCARVFLRFDR